MDILFYSALGAGSLIAMFNVSKDVNDLTDKLEKIHYSKSYTPESLKIYLENSSKNNQFQESKEFARNPINSEEIIGSVFLKGIASTSFPINSTLSPNIPLIYSNYYINKIYSKSLSENGSFNPFLAGNYLNYPNYPSLNSESIINQSPFFKLYAYEEKKTHKSIQYKKKSDFSCRVGANSKVNALDAQRLLFFRIHSKALTTIEKIIIFIYLILEAIFSRQFAMKGIKVGYMEREMGIKNDTFLNVYGKIAYNINKKTLRMDSPEYFLRDKTVILNTIYKKIRDKRIILILAFIPLLISLVKLGSKCVQLFKRWRNFKQILQNQMNIKKIVINDVKCCVCSENINNIILLPCKHFCVCKDCYNKMDEQKKCPQCNSLIIKIIEIFLP